MSTAPKKLAELANAVETLGSLIGEGEGRDAVHVAVLPVVAAETLYPGQHLGIDREGKATPRAVKLVGIVDPFLLGKVHEGQRFWLMLYPRTITSLRHVWTHPDFPDEIVSSISEPMTGDAENMARERLAGFLKGSSSGLSVDQFVDAAYGGSGSLSDEDGYEHRYHGNDEYIVIYGDDAYGEIPESVWPDISLLSGKPIPERRPQYFSCSC